MAEKTQIMDALDALAVHCRPPLMSVEDRTRWMRDWCDDLVRYPLDTITNATRKWRHSGATKFPTAGQLLPLIRESEPVEKTEDSSKWRPLSDEEYNALSLRDKIRHQQILATQAFGRAGPMFRNTSGGVSGRYSGYHILPEDMPPEHYRWREIGQGHAKEAQRLREYLRRPDQTTAA